MRFIGIDPGYNILGWAVIENASTLIDFGVITTSKDTPFDERLLQIHKSLINLFNTFHPDSAAIEKVFFQKNTKTAIEVAKVIGVIILTLKMKGILFEEYTPPQIKLAITGYGKATKAQMQIMMKRLFNISHLPKPDDAADALALALCHSCKYRLPLINKIKIEA